MTSCQLATPFALHLPRVSTTGHPELSFQYYAIPTRQVKSIPPGVPSVMPGKDPAHAGSRSAFDVARASRPWNVMGRMPVPRQATTRTFPSSSPRLCPAVAGLSWGRPAPSGRDEPSLWTIGRGGKMPPSSRLWRDKMPPVQACQDGLHQRFRRAEAMGAGRDLGALDSTSRSKQREVSRAPGTQPHPVSLQRRHRTESRVQ